MGWSVLVLLGGLLIFYGWRTGSNQQELSQRNLRELDRIGRAVEGRTRGFADGMEAWYGVWKNENDRDRAASFRRLVPNLLGAPVQCPGQPRAEVSQDRIRFCYGFTATDTSTRAVQWWSGDFALDSLIQTLRTDVFDATFLADDSAGVFLTSSAAGTAGWRPHRGLAGLRLQAIPPDTVKHVGGRVSTVRTVTIAGREYRLFLQPLDIQGPGAEPADGSRPPVQWSVGGLVSTSRFRAESLALDPPHLIFLGLLLVLAVLALPFLRAALMGPLESIKATDVYLLSLSLVLATGTLGIAAADIRYFGPYARSLDQNLAAAAARVEAALHREIRLGLNEMGRWRQDPERFRSDTLIFQHHPDRPQPVPDVTENRYVHFQMLIWIDSTGMQTAKLTPRATNTPLIPVRTRDYFRRIRDEQSYVHPRDSTRYYLESIRSRNTGEKIAMLSAPHCWHAEPAESCPPEEIGALAMTTRLASLDLPLLPPGVSFAVIRRDGVTLFHADPERNLEENFLDETGDNGHLRSLFAAWDSGQVRAAYMGRRSRMHVRPLDGTGIDSLSLVVVLDDGLPGTAHVEGIFLSLSAFIGWVLVLLAAFLFVELLLPGRLRWAWPDHDRPWKYPVLTGLLLCFTALLVAQAVIASRFRVPIDTGSFLVPVQALSVALLVQSAGWSELSAAWRNPRVIGWAALLAATVVQFGLNLDAAAPHNTVWLLRGGQTALAVLAGLAVLRLDRLERRGKAGIALEPWYVATIVAALATSTIMPAYLFHQEAMTQQMNRLIQYEHTQLLAGMDQREHRIRANNRQIGLATGFDNILIDDDLDLAVPPVLGAAAQTARGCRHLRSDLRARVFSRIERRMPFLTAAAVEMRHLGPGSGGMQLETCERGVLRLASADSTSAARLEGGGRIGQAGGPGYGTISGWRRFLLLCLLAAGTGITAALARWLGRRVFLLDLPRYDPLDLRQHVTDQPLAGRTSVIAICKGSMNRRPLEEAEDSLYYLDLLKFAGTERDLDAELTAARNQRKLLVLDHFDHHLDNPTWNEKLLHALEDHVSVRRCKVVLMTSREPCALFPLVEHESGGRPTTERWIRLLGRFVDVAVADLSRLAGEARNDQPAGAEPVTGIAAERREFRKLAPADHAVALNADDDTEAAADGRNLAVAAGPEPAGHGIVWRPSDIVRVVERARHVSAGLVTNAQAVRATAERTLDRETRGRRRLEQVAEHVRKRPDFAMLTPEGIVEQVRDMADSYYHALWSILDQDEKLVVTQLAHGVVVNPNGKRAVRRLLARRVLVRDPELRLMNESIRRFIREEVPASIIADWERGAPTSPWQRLRFPIGLGLVAVVAFLFVTQRSAFDNAMALVTAAGVGTTAILKLLGSARWPGRSE